MAGAFACSAAGGAAAFGFAVLRLFAGALRAVEEPRFAPEPLFAVVLPADEEAPDEDFRLAEDFRAPEVRFEAPDLDELVFDRLRLRGSAMAVNYREVQGFKRRLGGRP